MWTSPCKCLKLDGRKPFRVRKDKTHDWVSKRQVNQLIHPGETRELVFDYSDQLTVTASGRPYMFASIQVVDTPLVAITDESGHFSIDSIPLGKYKLSIWHVGIRNIESPRSVMRRTVNIANGQIQSLAVQLRLKKD